MRKVLALLIVFVAVLSAVRAFASEPDAPDLTYPSLLRTNPFFAQKLEELSPQPTGDALWDRYSADVWQRNAPSCYPYATFEQLAAAALLPDEVMAAWENEFADDPRYWQMRCWFAMLADAQGTHVAASTPALFAVALQHAPDDPALAFLDFTFRKEAEPDYEHSKKLTLELMPELADRFADESLFHYFLALSQADSADLEDCFESLRLGNAAAQNRMLHPFPLSHVLTAGMSEEFAGSRYVCGMVAANNAQWDFTPGQMKSMTLHTISTDDMKTFQLWHDALCRLILLEEGSRSTVIFGTAQMRELTESIWMQHSYGASAEQRESLWKFVQDQAKLHRVEALISGRLRQLDEQYLFSHNKLGAEGAAATLMLDLLAAEPGKQQELYRDDYGWSLWLWTYGYAKAQYGDRRVLDSTMKKVRLFKYSEIAGPPTSGLAPEDSAESAP